MRILYLQTIRLDTDLCRSSRLGLTGALVAAGCDVTLVAGWEIARPTVPAGVRFIGILAPRVPFLASIWFNVAAHAVVLLEMLRHRPSVIVVDPYTFHAAFPWDILNRVRLSSTRVVMDIRSGIFHDQHRGWARLPRRVLRSISLAYARRVFAGFTTVTPRLRDTLVEQFGLPSDRIGVWQSAAPDVEPTPLRAAPVGELRVLYHGSFGPDRGLVETVEAMRLLAQSHPRVQLLLLGSGSEEPALRRGALGLPNVTFHAPVPHAEVFRFLADSDVGIVPFLPTPVMRSSSPLKLMEYLSAGRPVIASRIEAVTDVVGFDGAIFLDAQTPRAIADAIAWAADHPRERAELAERGRSLMADKFTWQRQALDLRAFLSALDRSTSIESTHR